MENLWFYHSPKLNQLAVVKSDVVFAYIMLLETRSSVSSYGPAADNDFVEKMRADLRVSYHDGRSELVVCRRDVKAGRKVTASGSIVTAQDIDEARVEFDNALTLCRAMTAARGFDLATARRAISSIFLSRSSSTVGELTNHQDIDPALLYAALARLISEGALFADLSSALYCKTTIVTRTRDLLSGQPATDRWPPEVSEQPSAAAVDVRPTPELSSNTYACDVAANHTRGRRRELIPQHLVDLKWPGPDPAELGKHAQKFEKRKRAVEAYRAGTSFKDIKDTIQVSENEVRRLVKKCVERKINGSFAGYHALVPGQRFDSYHRTVDVDYNDETPGFAGAWSRLLAIYPDLRKDIFEEVFKHKSSPDGRVLDIVGSWARIADKLKEQGIKDKDYPFRNADGGESAFANYCHNLIFENAEQYLSIYQGESALKRWNLTGGVPQRLIRPIRAGSFAILDFHRHSQPTSVAIDNGFGTILEKRLPRWYFAVLVEEMYSSILACIPTLEKTPSSDSGLETIDCFIRPQAYATGIAAAGTYIPAFAYEQIPELAGNSLCVLRLDNALGNIADGFVRNVIYTLGCAVHFGPTYTWMSRSIVERTIKEVKQRTEPLDNGIAAMPYGELAAAVLDACRDHNTCPSGGLNYSSPIEATRSALQSEQCGLLAQPLPRAVLEDSHLLDFTFPATVRGNHKKGVRPYFQFRGRRFTNDELRSRPDLIGMPLLCKVRRFDVRQMRASLIESRKCGDSNKTDDEYARQVPLGQMHPDRRIEEVISIRADKLLSSSGKQRRARAPQRHSKHDSPTMPARKNYRPKTEKTDRDAIRLAKQQTDRARHANEKGDATAAPTPAKGGSDRDADFFMSTAKIRTLPHGEAGSANDPFGLFSTLPKGGRHG